MPSLARARRLARLSVVALLCAASSAGAQSFSATFAPGCSPMLGCTTARFQIGAPAGGLALNTLSVTLLGTTYLFLPSDPAFPTTGSYVAQDDVSPFGGFTTIGAGGAQLFIDFVNTGDPMNPGFPLTLGAFSTGYVEVDVTPDASGTPFAFSYVGQLDDGSTISGAVGVGTTTPEPATIALVATGLAGVVGRHRLRRASA